MRCTIFALALALLAPISRAESTTYITAGGAYGQWRYFSRDASLLSILAPRADIHGKFSVAGPSLGLIIQPTASPIGLEITSRVLRAFNQEMRPDPGWNQHWFFSVSGNAMLGLSEHIHLLGGLNALRSFGQKKVGTNYLGLGYQGGIGFLYERFFLKATYDLNSDIGDGLLFGALDGEERIRGYNLTLSYLFQLP